MVVSNDIKARLLQTSNTKLKIIQLESVAKINIIRNIGRYRYICGIYESVGLYRTFSVIGGSTHYKF